jgi:SpoIID/LytB domain protein
MRLKFSLLVLTIFSFFFLLTSNRVLAISQDECLIKSAEELYKNGQVDECGTILQQTMEALMSAQETNKKDLASLRSQLATIKKKIVGFETQIKKAEADIVQREEDLAYAREIFNEKALNQYKSLRLYDPILPFLFSDDASKAFKEISFRQKAADEDRKTMDQYAGDLAKLKADKDNLEKSKAALDPLQKQVAEKEKFLAGEVAKTETFLATLSAKQQAFLAAKLGSLGLSRSAYNMKGGCSSDIDPFKSPGFSPAFAFFSFGVPNRIGLNQFGAKGRADQGQNYTQILNAYYSAEITSGYNTGITIHIVGTNEYGQSFNDYWNVEDYVKHIYEMPTSWPMEALKAQAIAARSYALSYTSNGAKSICSNQQCQVVKRELNDGKWQQAVEETRGVVLTAGGNPVTAWYSSTHGGYAYTSGDIGWSQTSWTKRLQDSSSGINNFSDLFNNSYDKSSSVFYCDWGSRSQYNKTAWLRSEEVADIANVILLAKKDGSTQKHLVQVDKPNPDGVDTWDAGRVKSELSSRGGTPLESASNISIGADFGSGKTTSVNIDGHLFDGQDFKTYFNLRAPANIQIVGPLFNVEKR